MIRKFKFIFVVEDMNTHEFVHPTSQTIVDIDIDALMKFRFETKAKLPEITNNTLDAMTRTQIGEWIEAAHEVVKRSSTMKIFEAMNIKGE